MAAKETPARRRMVGRKDNGGRHEAGRMERDGYDGTDHRRQRAIATESWATPTGHGGRHSFMPPAFLAPSPRMPVTHARPVVSVPPLPLPQLLFPAPPR